MDFLTSTNIFAHLDCDCFFASCEMMRDPHLRDKCVCVGGDIIVTSNYRARKYGVKVGTPIWEARKMIPKKDFVFLPPDMHFYGQISDKIQAFLGKWSNSIEVFSIDECWLDITGVPEYWDKSPNKGLNPNMQIDAYASTMNDKRGTINYQPFASFLQSEIMEKIGIPVSIGVSNTRLRAKILSDINKPRGICVGVTSEAFGNQAGKLPFGDIPFIGPASQEKLHYFIKNRNIAGFCALGFDRIRELLGRNGANIWLELAGVNAFHPGRQSIDKSISATRSFNDRKTADKNYIWNHLLMNFERAYTRLIDKNLETNHIVISFRDKEFRWFGIDHKLPRHTQRREEIIDILHVLFHKSYSSDIVYRTTGITFTGLEIATPKQYTLEEQPHILDLEKNQKLETIINALNKKFGRKTLTRGGLGTIDSRYMAEYMESKSSEESRRIRGFVSMQIG